MRDFSNLRRVDKASLDYYRTFCDSNLPNTYLDQKVAPIWRSVSMLYNWADI